MKTINDTYSLYTFILLLILSLNVNCFQWILFIFFGRSSFLECSLNSSVSTDSLCLCIFMHNFLVSYLPPYVFIPYNWQLALHVSIELELVNYSKKVDTEKSVRFFVLFYFYFCFSRKIILWPSVDWSLRVVSIEKGQCICRGCKLCLGPV